MPSYLNGSVIVVEVDSPDHLGFLEISDSKTDLGNDVTSDEFENLSRRRKPRVHLYPGQLQSLPSKEPECFQIGCVGLSLTRARCPRSCGGSGWGVDQNDCYIGLT